MEVIDHLVAGPMFRVDAGIDHQADGAPDIGFQAAIVVVGILVEPDVLAQPLGVESPSLGVGGVVGVLAKLRNAGQLLGDGDLQMMPRQSFVIRNGLSCIERPRFEFISVDEHRTGPGAVRGAMFVVGCRLVLFRVIRHRHERPAAPWANAQRAGEVWAASGPGVHDKRPEAALCWSGYSLGFLRRPLRSALMSANPSFCAMASKLLLVLLHLIDADLVNLLRRHVGGGALLYQKAVISFAVRQSPYARIVAAVGNVLSLQKLAEADVSRILPGRRWPRAVPL